MRTSHAGIRARCEAGGNWGTNTGNGSLTYGAPLRNVAFLVTTNGWDPNGRTAQALGALHGRLITFEPDLERAGYTSGRCEGLPVLVDSTDAVILVSKPPHPSVLPRLHAALAVLLVLGTPIAVALGMAGIAGILRTGGRVSPIVITIDGVATDFVATAMTERSTFHPVSSRK